MVNFLWACFDGGGNVPPSVGIARELRERGHDVAFAGRPEMAPRVTAAGFTAHVLENSYRHADRYDWHPRGKLFSYLTSPAVGREILDLCTIERPDVLVVDAMFGAALDAAPEAGLPVAVMLHTMLHRTLDGWEILMADQSNTRARSGFGELPDVRTLWERADALHVNALEEFDSTPLSDWPNARHGAPVLEQDARAAGRPAADGGTEPVVLVSFSTAVAQASAGKVQRTLDALADLPVRTVATVGSLDPETLRVPDNATAVRFADHGALMREGAFVVTHGGHGTAMRALSHGLPMICLTGQARDQDGVAALDQPRIARFLHERGAGISLDADCPAHEIRDAAARILATPEYTGTARELARLLRRRDGAALAADRLEQLVPTVGPGTTPHAELGAYT